MRAVLGMAVRSGTNPGITPNTDGLPGLEQVRRVVGALSTWGLVACVAAVLIGGALMAFGRMGNRTGMSDGGKSTLLMAVAGAAIIGAANALVAFFAAIGAEV